MNAIVFAGPTIGPEDVAALCPCMCLPPAAQGDIYRATLMKPRAIGVIDGYFHGVPAVWHKEILWAMAQGIHVFGASSMGALRAAELADFGMRGVGRIFEQFRDGVLEDDDEVAVLHAPGEVGYAALSEAMVNIRATLARAAGEGVLSAAGADALCRAAKGTFYQDRDWQALLSPGGALAEAEAEALRAWLPEGRVDQKRRDAEAMLAELEAYLAMGPAPMRVDYSFEWTHLWDSVVADGVPVPAGEGSGDVADPEPVLDELRLDPAQFRSIRRAALLRLLASGQALPAEPPDRGRLRAARARFCAEHGLFGRSALDAWLDANGLDEAGFAALVEEEARIEALITGAGDALTPHVIAELRAQGLHPALQARARDKQAAMAAGGRAGSGPASLNLLVDWFFGTCLDREVPENLDQFVADLGLHSRDQLARILARELSYRSSCKDQQHRFEHNPLDGNVAS